MSVKATILPFLSLPQLVALHRAFIVGILDRRSEPFYENPQRVSPWPTGRGRLLEALEVVEKEMDMRPPAEEEA